MATNIKLKKSSISGKTPLAGDLEYGELAINYADGKLFYKNSSNEIKSFIDSGSVQQLIFAAGGLGGGSNNRALITDYSYVASAGQTTFSGLDEQGDNLAYTGENLMVHVNGILLVNGIDYTANDGSSIQLDEAADSGDIVGITAVYGDSASVLSVVDSAYVQARQITYNVLDSSQILNLISSVGYITSAIDSTNVTNLIDSAYINARVEIPEAFDSNNVIGIVDSAYISSRISAGIDSAAVIETIENAGYTKYDSFNTIEILSSQNYATQSDLTTAINNLIDGAPGTLDTLNEIASALNDDDSAYGTLVNLIGEKTSYDSQNTIALVDSAYVQARVLIPTGFQGTYDSLDGTPNILDSADVIQTITNANFSKFDSLNAISILDTGNYATEEYVTSTIDSAYINARVVIPEEGVDSATVLSIVTEDGFTKYDSSNTVGLIDSAYINARVDTGTDSATVLSLIQGLVDSAYVTARAPAAIGEGGVTFVSYDFTADSGQTVFTGVDNAGDTLKFTQGQIQVYLNGILLVDSADYIANASGTQVTLIEECAANDDISIASFTALAGLSVGAYDYFANSGQSVFSGLDIDGNQLSYSPGNVLVHVNGLLLTDSDDYTATNGTSITIPGGLDSGDIVNVVAFKDVAVNYVDSAAVLGLIDSAYINARVVIPEEGLDSAGIIQTVVNANFSKFDSLNAVSILDAGNYATESYVTNTVDSAYIAARLGTTIDSASTALIVQEVVDSAYVTQRAPNVQSIIDSNFAELQSSIIPAVDDAIDLGSPSKRFKDLYLGPGSLFINNKKVLEDDAGTIRVRTDSDQNLSVRTFGTGQTTIQSETGINVTTTNSGDITFTTSSGNIEFNGDISVNATKSINSSNADPINFGDAIDLNSNRIQNVGDPVDSNDAANRGYVLDRISTSLSTYATETYVTNAIDSIVAAAPGALNTLNELAAALGDDENFSTTITNLIATKIDSADAITIVESYGYTTYDSDNAAEQIEAYGYITSSLDSSQIIQLISDDNFTKFDSFNVAGILDQQGFATEAYVTSTIDSAYINERVDAGTDSATVVTIISNTVDSAYIQARQLDVGSSGVDSSAIISLVDSAYVSARTPQATVGAVSVRNYQFTADSGQTLFSGADTFGNTLSYVEDRIQVFVNGILLLDSADYTATNGSQITLTAGADINDTIIVAAYEGGYNESLETQLTSYEYVAVTGQTEFTGVDRDGNTLSYLSGEVLVFLNGTLLVDGNDYAATSGSSIVFTEGVDSGDFVSIVKVGVTGVVTLEDGDIQNKIESTVDSAYIQARQNYTTITDFEFISDSGQSTFTGVDAAGNTLEYTPGSLLVHLNGILLKDSADYAASTGQSIILTDAADSADVLSITSFGNLSFSAPTWSEATGNITASVGKKYIVDCSSSPVTVTLPSSPAFGDEVKIIDGTGSAASNNITINRNSNKILGADSDFTLDINRVAVDLVYYNTAQGWIISGNS